MTQVGPRVGAIVRPEAQNTALWVTRTIKVALLIVAGVGVGLMLGKSGSPSHRLAGRIMCGSAGILFGSMASFEGIRDIIGARRSGRRADEAMAQQAGLMLRQAAVCYSARIGLNEVKGQLSSEDQTKMDAQLAICDQCYEQLVESLLAMKNQGRMMDTKLIQQRVELAIEAALALPSLPVGAFPPAQEVLAQRAKLASADLTRRLGHTVELTLT